MEFYEVMDQALSRVFTDGIMPVAFVKDEKDYPEEYETRWMSTNLIIYVRAHKKRKHIVTVEVHYYPEGRFTNGGNHKVYCCSQRITLADLGIRKSALFEYIEDLLANMAKEIRVEVEREV